MIISLSQTILFRIFRLHANIAKKDYDGINNLRKILTLTMIRVKMVGVKFSRIRRRNNNHTRSDSAITHIIYRFSRHKYL